MSTHPEQVLLAEWLLTASTSSGCHEGVWLEIVSDSFLHVNSHEGEAYALALSFQSSEKGPSLCADRKSWELH